MAEDATTPPFPVEEPIPAANQIKTETKIETIETEVPGKRTRHAGEFLGMSGRFWVTIISIAGATYVMILVLASDMQSETKAMMAGAYIALASSIGNTYMGQNAGPSKPKTS